MLGKKLNLEDQLRDQLGWQLRKQLGYQLGYQLWDQLGYQLWVELKRKLDKLKIYRVTYIKEKQTWKQ